jgi:predicted acylesterase/phospholipase RssA
MSATNIFDTTPLYSTLEEIIDFDKLNSADAPQVVITATNIEKGIGERFNNREMEITPKHIVSSGSLPPSFQMVKIGDYNYWDGGLFSNTPLKPALKALEQMGGADVEKEIIMIELFPQEGETPKNMPEVMERISSLTFESKIVFDQKMFSRTKEYIELFEGIEKELPKDSKLRKTPAFQQLKSYSKIDKLTIIKYTGDENVLGTADFTQQTIDRRIEQGYADGLQHLETQK